MSETKPPQSSYAPGPKRWSPAGVVFAASGIAAAGVMLGTAAAPLFRATDYTGYVQEGRLKACETRLDERAAASEKALDGERERTSRCYDKLGACQSQQGAAEQLIESMEKKRRR